MSRLDYLVSVSKVCLISQLMHLHLWQRRMGGLDGEVLGDLAPRRVVYRQIRIEFQLVGVHVFLFAGLRRNTPTLVGATSNRRLDGSTEAAGLVRTGLRPGVKGTALT